MLKVHVYHGNGKSATIKSDVLGFTILRQDSVKDEGGYVTPKGQQLVMLEVTEVNGELIIKNIRTDETIKI